MKLKKMVLIIIAAILLILIALVIFFAVRMNLEHKAYLEVSEKLEQAEKDISGLNDELKDARKAIAGYEGRELEDIENEENESKSKLGGVSIADISAFDLSDELTIKLAADDKVKEDHYVKVGVTLSLNTTDEDYATYSESLATNEGIIKDTINKVVGKMTYTEIQEMKVSEVQNAILKELKKMYDSEFIVGVSFSSWYVQ